MKKLSTEMFIKRKTKVGKGDAYRMLERFKTLVTYEKKINFNLDNCVRYKTRFFARHSPMSSANTEACL